MKHFEEVLALARTATTKESYKRIQQLVKSIESEQSPESQTQATILKTLLWRVQFGETLEGFIQSAKSPDDKELAAKVYQAFRTASGR